MSRTNTQAAASTSRATGLPGTADATAKAIAPEGRRTRRRRELHQNILATAAGLFARDGYDVTTVEKIASASDIAQATFFNHFRSKEDVLREVGQDVFTRFQRLVEEQLARRATTRGRLAGFAARSAELVRRAPEMTRRVLIAVLRSSRPGESGAELASMQAAFANLLADGRQAGDVRDDVDLDLAAELLVSVVMGAMTHWINDPDYPLEHRLGATLSLVSDRLLVSTGDNPDKPARTKSAPGKRKPR
ncbi:MAG TPA: TetR/AcrR family transcriptional regulator [Candidatus Limnocylindrales bacterium]|nr:TetR/AcrR family transcriptional regulator [Candidatus Limnocylindrales bacterium]